MQEQKTEFYYHWDKLELLENASKWNKDMRKRMRTATEDSAHLALGITHCKPNINPQKQGKGCLKY